MLTRNFKAKQRELAAIYGKQRNNKVLKEFRGELTFDLPTGSLCPKVMFVGDLGYLSKSTLHEVMQSVGLDAKHCYFSSLFKHSHTTAVPSNILDTVLRYVEDEIAVLNPKVVVPIGQASLSAFVEHECISTLHGQPYDWETYWLVPIFVPALVKTGMQTMEELVSDLQTIADYARKKR